MLLSKTAVPLINQNHLFSQFMVFVMKKILLVSGVPTHMMDALLLLLILERLVALHLMEMLFGMLSNHLQVLS
jgi:hypothetical protein